MRAASPSPFRSGFLGRVTAAIGGVMTAWGRRRLVGELSTFDDHLLRDIGLTRADVNAALLSPVLDDPTLELAARAQDWRTGRQAVAREREHWYRLVDDSRTVLPDRQAA